MTPDQNGLVFFSLKKQLKTTFKMIKKRPNSCTYTIYTISHIWFKTAWFFILDKIQQRRHFKLLKQS